MRGAMPRGSWPPDGHGLACATDPAFMSASLNREISLQDGDHSEFTLWRLLQSVESADTFHCGADISSLSQFAEEQEVLFPPCTMLVARQSENSMTDEIKQPAAQGKTTITEIDVVPCFV